MTQYVPKSQGKHFDLKFCVCIHGHSISSGSRPGHRVSGTRSKFPNLNENGQNLIFCEVFLTQNTANIFSRSATVLWCIKNVNISLDYHTNFKFDQNYPDKIITLPSAVHKCKKSFELFSV